MPGYNLPDNTGPNDPDAPWTEDKGGDGSDSTAEYWCPDCDWEGDLGDTLDGELCPECMAPVRSLTEWP